MYMKYGKYYERDKTGNKFTSSNRPGRLFGGADQRKTM